MARPRYRPKLPPSLHAAEDDAYVSRIARDAVLSEISDASGVDMDLSTVSSTPGSWARFLVGGVIVAIVILVCGVLLDRWTAL